MAVDGYFTDESMLRRVHRENVVALSGARALLMQATHPVAFAGFFAHTGALDEPYERLNRTARVMDTIGFGSRADADRATRRVRAMHRRVRGVTAAPAGRFPAGTPYAADDPALLLWILATLPADLRRQYRLSWDPARGLALAGGAEYVKRVLVPLLPPRIRYAPSARAA